jgi:hypothetical protein
MTVTIDSTNPRSVAALGLMVRAKGWARVRTLDGQKFYGVPSRSRPGLLHLADTQTCTCEDHKHRGAECSHILAVRLHVAQVKAKASLRARRPRRSREEVAAGSAAYERIMGDHFGEEG